MQANHKLLEQIAEEIVKDAEHFDMRDWTLQRECGTAGCIAGWACLIANCQKSELKTIDTDLFPDLRRGSMREDAKQLLGLNEYETEALFYTQEWPSPFRLDYHTAKSHKCKAKIAAARIHHFIQTGE